MMRPSLSRFSLRYSIFVWVAGALVGWTVAITSVYVVLNSEGPVVATPDNGEATTQTAAPDPKLPMSDDEIRKLQDIAPAAGPRGR